MELYVILLAHNVFWSLMSMLSSDQYERAMWIASLGAQSVVNLVLLAFVLLSYGDGGRYLYRAGLILAPFLGLFGWTVIWAPA